MDSITIFNFIIVVFFNFFIFNNVFIIIGFLSDWIGLVIFIVVFFINIVIIVVIIADFFISFFISNVVNVVGFY